MVSGSPIDTSSAVWVEAGDLDSRVLSAHAKNDQLSIEEGPKA